MYDFIEVEENRKYRFLTDNKLVHEVEFSPIDFVFKNETALKSLTFELSLILVSQNHEKLPPTDLKISFTLHTIIKMSCPEIGLHKTK